MNHLERPGCTCRAAGDAAAYMHDEGCPARGNDPAPHPVHVIEGTPALSSLMRNQIRADRIRDELVRLDADIASGGTRLGAFVLGPGNTLRTVDGLAALGLLIELPDGAGTQAAWAALLTLPEIT